jgi:phosphatidylethanolamine-binding protein (PEBP) family uncharacterized protein
MTLGVGDRRRRVAPLWAMPRLLAVIAAAIAVMTQNALAFSASFSWAGIAACNSTSPAFRITAAPAGTKQLRFKMVDLNAPNYPHGGSTVAYGGPTVARGAISYVGPCPPQGSKHTYRWTIEALDPSGTVLGTASASGVFSR